MKGHSPRRAAQGYDPYDDPPPPMTARQAATSAAVGLAVLVTAILLNIGWTSAGLPVLDEPVRTSATDPSEADDGR